MLNASTAKLLSKLNINKTCALTVNRISTALNMSILLVLVLCPVLSHAVGNSISTPAVDYNGNFTVSWTVYPGSVTGGNASLMQRINGGSWVSIDSVGFSYGTSPISKTYTITASSSATYEFYVSYYYIPYPPCGGYPCNPQPVWGSSPVHTTVVNLNPPQAPAVSISSVNACSNSLTVNWSPGSGYPSGATRYYDYQFNDASPQSVMGTNLTSATRNLPDSSVSYSYLVRSYFVLNGDTSAKSGWTTKTVSKSWCPPGTPGTPVVTQPPTTTDTNVGLSWTAPTSGGTVHGYRLQRRDATAGSSWSTIYIGSNTAHVDNSGKTRGHTFEYRVLAYNGVDGPSSGIQSVYVPYAPPAAPILDDNVGGTAGYEAVYSVDWESGGGFVEGFLFQRIDNSPTPAPDETDWPEASEEIIGNNPQVRSFDHDDNYTGEPRYYHYRVKAKNRDAKGPWTVRTIKIIFYPYPGAVESFAAEESFGQLGLSSPDGRYDLRWTPPTGNEPVSYYKLNRLETSGGEYPKLITHIDGQTPYSEELSGGIPGHYYSHTMESCYISAELGIDESCTGYEETIQVYVPYTVPNTPTNLIGPDGSSVDGNFTISWLPSTTGVLDHYDLEETFNGSTTIENKGTITTFSRNNTGGQYVFRVRACSPDADSPLSPELACSPWSEAITFNVLATPFEFLYDLNDTSGLPVLGQGEFVAVTQGNLNIHDGAANYSVPIELPPAINNLKPNLALTYNSRKGNGVLGIGWELSGLSAISRCSPTFASENEHAQDSNPRYTDADRLCLDGKKLEIASSSTPASDSVYWTASAEYRTEIDQFAKITAVGQHDGAHAYFEVRTKNGLILSYGQQDEGQNSRIYAPGQPNGPVSVWALDKVEDRYGNNYTLHYVRNTDDGDYYASRIYFSPDSAVEFSYIDRDDDLETGQRSDVTWGFDAGHPFKHIKLLDKITTYINVSGTTSPVAGTKVKEYVLDYERSATTDRHRVSEISECGFDGASRVCAEPLNFDWQDGELGFDTTPTALESCSGEPITADRLQVGDIDNDGYSDLFSFYSTSYSTGGYSSIASVYWGTPSCFQEAGTWATPGAVTWKNAQLIGTPRGKALLVTEEDPNSTDSPKYQFIKLIELGRSAGTTNVHSLQSTAINPTSIAVVDINNDGLEDFLFSGTTWVQQNGSSISFTTNTSGIFLGSTGGGIPVEYNGDGLIDLLITSYNYNYAIKNAGNNQFDSNSSFTLPVSDVEDFQASIGFGAYLTFPGSLTHNALDINGDGKKDYAYHHVPAGASEGIWYLHLNTGDDFTSNPISTGISSGKRINQISYTYDWDKDGREDLIMLDSQAMNSQDLYHICAVTDCWNVLAATYDNNGFAFKELSVDPFNGNPLSANSLMASPGSQILRGDFNHDGLVDLSSGSSVWYAKQQQPDLLTSVTNGFGAQLQLQYSPLTGDDNNGEPLYTPASIKPTYPQAHADRKMQVVKQISVSDGQGDFNHRYFNYTGAKQDMQGRGFLGFEQIKITDAASGTITTTTYRQDFPLVGNVASVKVQDVSGNLISLTDKHYAVHNSNARFAYSDYSIQQQYGLTTQNAGNPLSVKKIESTFDQYGCLDEQTLTVGSGLSGTAVTGKQNVTWIDNDVTTDTSDWLLCFTDRVTQQTSTDGSNDLRTVITEFDPQENTLDVAERRDFIGEPFWRTTATDRNSNGVVAGTRVSAGDIDNSTTATRSSSLSNFEDGLYPSTATNAENHVTTFSAYDKRFGVVTTVVDPNNLDTHKTYDALGRLAKTVDAGDTVTRAINYRCDSGNVPVTCPSNAVYLSATEITHSGAPGKLGSPLSITFYDSLQRKVRSQTYSLNGAVVKVDTVYDNKGRVESVSEPFTGVSADYLTTYENYDALGRAHDISGPEGGSVHYDYLKEGALQKTVETVTVITPNGTETHVTQRYTNALGQVKQVIDADNTPVDYSYDSQGNLKTTTVNNNGATTITVTHDVAGNKTFINDPDTNLIQFEYNGFGELRRQTWRPDLTAMSKSIEYQYDLLGRKIHRKDTPADDPVVEYDWSWDVTKKGLLYSRSGNGFTESYQYDGLSRLQNQTTVITGLGSRSFNYGYDAFSRPQTVTYPDGLKVEHQYHAIGLKVQTRDITDAQDPGLLWTLGEDSDTRGKLYQQRFGNGVVTLTESDPANGRVSNILTGWPTENGLSGLMGNIQNLSYEFDTLGNLYTRMTARSDAQGQALELTGEFFTYDNLNRLKTSGTTWLATGTRERTYNYDALGNLTWRSDIGTLTYDQNNNAGVHAVTGANGQSYQYDDFGNMTQRGSDTVDYDVFNKPTRIGNTTFSYGPDHSRFKQVNGTRTIYYINGGSYEETINNGVVTQKSYVDGFLLQTKTAGTTKFTYLHRDHIGSVEAMTERWGNLVDRMSFDPWGQRQLADWDDGNPTGGDPNHYPTTRGFTGHEMLEQSKLIHMNGRVYDPTIGRFLNPDLLVQAPYNTQSFNRYAYVFNNPLSLVDPSGYAASYMEEIVVKGKWDGSATGMYGMDTHTFYFMSMTNMAFFQQPVDVPTVSFRYDMQFLFNGNVIGNSGTNPSSGTGNAGSSESTGDGAGSDSESNGAGLELGGNQGMSQEERALSRGLDIVVEAESWNGTPYAPNPATHPNDALNVYAGGNAVKGVAADCSGAVHGIYENAGLSYEYRNTATFATDYKKLGFSKVTSPQPGDIKLFNSHMGIYRGDKTYDLYSARNVGKAFSPTKSSWYNGTPTYYRHNSLMGN